MIHPPQSAGLVRYLLTGHLWTSPRLSARDRFIHVVDERAGNSTYLLLNDMFY